MCFLISIFLCFALVPKLVPRTVDFHWYWYRIQKFWYRDNPSLYHIMIPTYGLSLLKNQQTWCVNTECNCYVVLDVQLYYIFYFRVILNTKTNILVFICLDTYIIHDILLLSI